MSLYWLLRLPASMPLWLTPGHMDWLYSFPMMMILLICFGVVIYGLKEKIK